MKRFLSPKRLTFLLTPLLAASLSWAAGPPQRGGRGKPEWNRGGRGRPPILERLKQLDANKDGVISRDEFKGPADKFERLDRNKDGKIDARELPPLRLLQAKKGEGRWPKVEAKLRRARPKPPKKPEPPKKGPKAHRGKPPKGPHGPPPPHAALAGLPA